MPMILIGGGVLVQDALVPPKKQRWIDGMLTCNKTAFDLNNQKANGTIARDLNSRINGTISVG